MSHLLTNPYGSPKSEGESNARRPSALRTLVFGIGGAFIGYVALTIFANMEDFQFYSIRSTLTGESAMSEITAHPADSWIFLGLFITFVFGGALTGFGIARRHTWLA